MTPPTWLSCWRSNTRRWISGGIALALVGSATDLSNASEQRSFAQFRAQFYRALECRQTDITTGFHSLGAITSIDADGALFARGFDASHLVRNEQASPPAFEASIEHNRDLQQIFWTQSDDLVLYNVAWFSLVRAAKGSGQAPAPQKVLAEQFSLFFANAADLYPAHVRNVVWYKGMATNSGLELVQFDPALARAGLSGVFARQDGPILWDGKDLLVQLAAKTSGSRQSAFVYDRTQRSWRPIDFPALPKPWNFVLFRRGAAGIEIGAVVPGFGAKPDEIVIARQQATKLRVEVRGNIVDVLSSPSHDSLYGYIDSDRRFHAVTDDASDNERYWLRRFNGHELTNIGFLLEGRVAVVRLRGADLDVPYVQILERRRTGPPRVLRTECGGVGRGISNVFQSGQDYVYVPAANARKTLVVYLHGGPVNRIGPEGSWVSDLFTLAGFPTVAVNYTGSVGNWRKPDDTQDLLNKFGREVEQGVSTARSALKSDFTTVVIVADSFGSLPGLAALLTDRVHPILFVDISALVAPSGVFGPRQRLPESEAFANYLLSVERSFRTRLTPANVLQHAPGTQIVFIHGSDDWTAPREAVEQFTRTYNSLGPRSPARLVLVPEMRHEPETKQQYDLIGNSLNAVWSLP